VLFRSLAKHQPRPFVAGNQSSLIGDWRFEGKDWLKDSSGRNHNLTSKGATLWSFDPKSPNVPPTDLIDREVLVDFCHILLNANEFMYVD